MKKSTTHTNPNVVFNVILKEILTAQPPPACIIWAHTQTLISHTYQHIWRKKKSLTPPWPDVITRFIDQCVTLNKACPEGIQWDQQSDYKQTATDEPAFPTIIFLHNRSLQQHQWHGETTIHMQVQFECIT